MSALKGGNFRYRGEFLLGNFDVQNTRDVAVMQRRALITSPLPCSKRT
jgi:hypothetical protein